MSIWEGKEGGRKGYGIKIREGNLRRKLHLMKIKDRMTWG